MSGAIASFDVFKTPEAKEQFLAAYQDILSRWPVPYEEMDIATRFGKTNMIASGPRQAPPLFLLHCFFGTAAVWSPNMAELCQHFRVYAVNILGEPNLSQPTHQIKSREEFAQWMVDIFDYLQVAQAYMVGNSFGGFLTMNQAIYTPERLRGIVLISPAATFRQILPFYTHMLLPVMFGSETRLQKALDWAANGIAMDDCWANLFTLSLRVGRPTNKVFPAVFKTRELQQVKTPATLLIGDREVIYPPEATLRLAARLMPGLRTYLVPGANHIAAMANPRVVNQKIIEAFKPGS